MGTNSTVARDRGSYFLFCLETSNVGEREMTNQELADELYGQRTLGERAFPATAIHQTFRGSGFIQRGGAQARGRTGMHMRGVSRAHGSNLARGGFQSFGGSAGGVRMQRGNIHVLCKGENSREEFCTANCDG